jgi:hypothetical protein
MSRRLILFGVVWSLSLTLILAVRVVAIDNSGALIILVPALLGSFLVLRSDRTVVLGSAALLTALTSLASLFGGVGLLYMPPLVLFIVGAARGEQAADPPAAAGWFWARVAGAMAGMALSVAAFAPWLRQATACPARPGFPPRCDAPWTNLVGWEFHGAYPFWAWFASAIVGLVLGWWLVALAESVVHLSRSRSLAKDPPKHV